MLDRRPDSGQWVLLTYRLPREPSTPRLALWRKLKRLGVAQLSDGLVALPADVRTQEQLEWAADEVVAAGGAAGVWLAQPASEALEREIAEAMSAARAAEYAEIAQQAKQASNATRAERMRVLRRLRAQMRRVGRRDYFQPEARETARSALQELAEKSLADEEVQT